MVLEEGQVLDGKYVIVRALATGSMGEVYLGRHERIGKEVAVKVLRRDYAVDRAIVNRFEQEARIATAVKSSHVVDVYDLGELPSGERFIVMEYVDGESLGMRMTREGKLSARELGAITLQILDGLVAAHAAGVVHRDLKPDNVILTKRDGHEIVKLVDFGVSKRSAPDAPRDFRRATLDGMLLGTPMFMSPEQARGEPDGIDHRTDLFSLGVSMYEALSGEVPFDGDNVVSLLSRIMEDEEVPLEIRAPDVDPGLARIVKKAMAKDPNDRYQTASEMREAVAAWHSVFGSTSALRTSFDGVAHVSSPPIAKTNGRGPMPASMAAAALAAIVTATLARHPAPIAPPTTTAPVVAAVPPTPPPPPPTIEAPSMPAPRPIPSPITTPVKKASPPKPSVARDAGAAPMKNEEETTIAEASEPPPPDPPAIP